MVRPKTVRLLRACRSRRASQLFIITKEGESGAVEHCAKRPIAQSFHAGVAEASTVESTNIVPRADLFHTSIQQNFSQYSQGSFPPFIEDEFDLPNFGKAFPYQLYITHALMLVRPRRAREPERNVTRKTPIWRACVPLMRMRVRYV